MRKMRLTGDELSSKPAERALKEEKDRQRRLCLARRAALSGEEREEKSNRLSQNLLEALSGLRGLRPGDTILAYAAFGSEADPSLCLRELQKMGFRIAYPVILPERHMQAAVPFDGEEMEPDSFGIPTPAPDRSEAIPPEGIAAVIVPCVGFDRAGRRLGHGAGYYDRYLALCPRAPRLLAALAAQEMPEIAVGACDLPMDFVVTEEGSFPCEGRLT